MNIINHETGEVKTFELQSQEISALAKALTGAQGAMTSAQKDGNNPHFGKSYATLDSIWQAVRKPLSEHGLCVVQAMLPGNMLVTTLLHESGQWVRSYLQMNPVKNDPQGIGSALTYGRRYSLAAIVGICQADDDGEEGSATTEKTRATRPATIPHTQGTGSSSAPAVSVKVENGDPAKKPYRFPSTAAAKFFDKVQATTSNHYQDGAALEKALGGWFNFGNAELWNERLSYACDMARQPVIEGEAG